jgi:DNA-nicking Smr family endonuclease
MSTGGRRTRPLSDDERALWDGVTRAVTPLKRRRAAEPRGDAPSAAETPKTKAPAVTAPPAARPLRAAPPPLAPLGRRMKQKVARGAAPIDGRIDLHGMTQSEAHHALARFLFSMQRQGARLALVITGKGRQDDRQDRAERSASRHRGVLNRQVPLWLESPELRPLVVGFETASVSHGGDGALYVRVRRSRSVV